MADEVVRQEEERVIRDTIQGYPCPKSIEDIEIAFGEDHSGYPAVWVRFVIPETMAVEGPEWDSAYAFVNEIDRVLSEKRLSHWPYVGFQVRQRNSA